MAKETARASEQEVKDEKQDQKQAADGEDQTPKKKTGEGLPKATKEKVQKRIDRMYARMKEAEEKAKAERQKREEAQKKEKKQPEALFDDEFADLGEEELRKEKSLTKQDVEGILDQRDKKKEFMGSERRVLERHPDALNDNGSFNMNDPFVKKYIEIGKRNPELIKMTNGPELAESMAEKELGTEYQKGRQDEAKRGSEKGSYTASSTTSPPKEKKVELSEEEMRVARRAGMSPEEYAKHKGGK